ncbi:zinc-ribbon-domain-containing protein [Obelidium mucronatum]|nr:zinc-ribbon-domain-containing protein [Obelidium mucronatum]
MTSKWSSRDKGKSTRASLASNKLEDKRHDFNVVLNTDKHMTFHDKSSNIVGSQAHCCGKWYTCRFCHDEVSDHNIIRNLITTMMCMHCSTVQPAGQDCINVDCQKRVAKYYCKECKLWDDDPRKNIYHCYDCGICRIGKGLGQDYFHCKKCNVCMAISLKGRHKCIERNLESDCPICGEYMFTSTTTVIFMPCGHCIHYKCHQEYIQTSYQCPTCFKSLANMTEYFKRIDAMLAQHQMPPEYNKTQTFIYCNDCEKKCYAKFHFLYHKCIHCKGYNTKVLQTSELVEGTTIEGNNAALLASNLVEDGKPEVKETVSCCGGGSGSVATLSGHQPLSHSNSHHSILSHRSSSTSLHGVSLGSIAPVFSSSSSSLHTAPLLTQHSFGSLPQVFSGHQHIQSHQQNTSILYPHPYSASNSSNNLIGGPMSLQFQHQHQHQHHHPVTLPPPTAHHHQQQQQNRFSIANRSIMGIGETGSNNQPSFCTSQPPQHPNHQHLQQQQQQHPQHQQNHHHGYHREYSSSSSSHQQSHPSNNNAFGQN